MRTLLRSSLFSCAVIGLTSCANPTHIPDTPVFDLRGGTSIQFQDLEAGADESLGPHPGLEALISYEVDLEGTTATLIDVGGSYHLLDLGGDIDGNFWRAYTGLRRTWRMDRPLRPTGSVGVSFTTIDPTDFDNRFEIRGPASTPAVGSSTCGLLVGASPRSCVAPCTTRKPTTTPS